MVATCNGFPGTARPAVEIYLLEKSLAPIPLPPRSKDPGYPGWQNLRLTPDVLDEHFPPDQARNVGVLNGEPSANHHDVDLDCAEALRVAPLLLPETGWIFGRKSAPGSHRIYRTERPLDSAQVKFKDLDGEVLVELRGTGGLTIYPPSSHKETGEAIVWERFTEPAEVDLADLERAVAEVAAAALLARCWPDKGSRDDAAMALTGALLRGGWSTKRTSRFVGAVALAAGDEEARARASKAEATAKKQDAGQNTTGWPTLAKLVGDEVVQRVRQWLGLDAGTSADSTPPPWSDPVPLGDVPDVPAFPVAVLPERLRRLVEETAWAMNCPLGFVAAPLLTLAGGALANSRHLAITRTHVQPPLLYTVTVSPPGTTKSPVLKLLRRPFDVVQNRYLEEWRIKMDAWEAKEKQDRGPRPAPKRCLVSDVTTESLGTILGDNERGLVMVKDELAGLVTGMNQYKGGKGNDRQVYLALWAGDAVLIDRKSDKSRQGAPLYVLDPFTAIIGSIQPDVLGRLRGEPIRGILPPNDGFLDRWLFDYPGGVKAVGEQWREVSEDALNAWQKVVEKLLELKMIDKPADKPGERQRPFYVHLTPCGRQAWERFTHAHAEEINADDFPPHLAGPWAKLKGYGGRLALIVHFLRWACGEVAGEDVDGESMDRAAKLVTYFKAHARKVYVVMDADPRLADARCVLQWLERHPEPPIFSRRDVHQGLRRNTRFENPENLNAPLNLLEEYGYVRTIPTDAFRRPGRQAAPKFERNPLWVRPQYPRYPQNDAPASNGKPSAGICEDIEDIEDVSQECSGTSGDGPPSFRLVQDAAELAAVANAIEESVLIGLDVETTGLDPKLDRIRLLSLTTDTIDGGTFTYVIDLAAIDPTPLWEPLANKPLVIHNGVFDLSFLRPLGFVPAGPVHDTLLLAKLLTAGTFEDCDLATVVKRELGRDLDKAAQRSDWSGALRSEQIKYAADDAAVLVPLLEKLTAKIKAANLEQAAQIEQRCLPGLVWLANNGVAFDCDRWEALAANAKVEAERLRSELNAIAPKCPDCLDFATWSWDSPQQMKEVFALVGVAIENTDDDALAGIDHPLAALLRQYRDAQKRNTTYGKDWLKHVAADGRVFSYWKQYGAKTGRMASGDPNMQNVPRDPAYRQCFRPGEGRVLVKADYSQIELRIAAKVANETRMIEAYRRGDDLHTLTAQRMTGKADVTKRDRQLAKPVNFGLIYGLGVSSLCRKAKTDYGLDLSEEDAQRYRDAFFAAYPGIGAWHKRLKRQHATETRTLTGRRVLVEADLWFGARANFTVQGTGGDGIKRALALLWERRDQCPGASPVLIVHDEIVIECDEAEADAVATWLKAAMVEAMAPLIEPVPVEVEVKMGRSWGGD
jgi:DNA polymerase-1